MNKARLLKLAALLEADAKNQEGIKFDLNVIVATDTGYGLESYAFEEGDKPLLDCRTAACAVGLACISGAFKNFTFEVHHGEILPIYTNKHGTHLGFGEAEIEFFGLTMDQSEFLFLSSSYPKSKRQGAIGERAVAKRIRDFVAGKITENFFNKVVYKGCYADE